MSYKFAIFNGDIIEKHEFDCYENAKEWISFQIDNFKKKNLVSDEKKDKHFLQFKDCLEVALHDERYRNEVLF
jgi:hypothetical protein